TDIKPTRDKILIEQNNRCAICTEEITENSGSSLDHQHKLKSEEIGIDGAGLIRGVLCRNCNVYEGKIWNNSTRYGRGKSVAERIQWLEQLIEYYKKGTYDLIHPSEIPKAKKLMKSSYNKLKKIFEYKQVSNSVAMFPIYPKSGKLTKKLEKLFIKYDLKPIFYS
ncbi:MAG: hypothetical protein KAI79_01790, partial [Bacteroidales bacterium]|nr:hypothetical protein [Bacteroidales bacterium]